MRWTQLQFAHAFVHLFILLWSMFQWAAQLHHVNSEGNISCCSVSMSLLFSFLLLYRCASQCVFPIDRNVGRWLLHYRALHFGALCAATRDTTQIGTNTNINECIHSDGLTCYLFFPLALFCLLSTYEKHNVEQKSRRKKKYERNINK